MDELEGLARKWDENDRQEQLEQQADGQAKTEQEPESVLVDPSDDAAEMAGFVFGAAGGFLKMFEPRLDVDGHTEESKGECAPLVEKYELHKGGGGQALGFKPELQAGLFLGRWVRSIIKQFKFWREHDRQQEDAQDHGNQRKHEFTEQAQPVSGAERVREKPDAQETVGDSYAGLSVDSVG